MLGLGNDDSGGRVRVLSAQKVVSKRPAALVEDTEACGPRVQDGPRAVAGVLEQLLRVSLQAQFPPQLDQHIQPSVGLLEGTGFF